MKSGIEIITEERQRQIEVEGWDSEHDSDHDNESLATAAACYATPINERELTIGGRYDGIPTMWPWDKEWWKPTPENRVRELAKAGALMAAEIDRLNEYQSSLQQSPEAIACAEVSKRTLQKVFEQSPDKKVGEDDIEKMAQDFFIEKYPDIRWDSDEIKVWRCLKLMKDFAKEFNQKSEK
jgi:hypothetical protein